MRRLLFVCLLLLSACGDATAVLPEGPQTLSGSITPAEISLSRRGTHILTLADQTEVSLESPTVNLRRYAGRVVALRGVYEPNLDPSLPPVLVVEEIVQSEDVSREWSSPELGLTLQIPSSWGTSESEGRAEFLPSGSLHPVMTIETADNPLPQGTPIVLDQRRAVRMTDLATGAQAVAVDRGDDHLRLTFQPGEQEEPEVLRTQWLSLLQSLDVHEEPRSPAPTTGTGATGGAPCGGPAGVLCPARHYCEITDAANNIGSCKPL